MGKNLEPAKYKITEEYHGANGTIASAVKRYADRGVPLSQLLTDYDAVLTYSKDLVRAINPWEYYKKGIRKDDVVKGVSLEETLFNSAAMSLHRQKPIDVISSIFYRNRQRNDTGIESIMVDHMLSIQKEILVINPSPYVIRRMEDDGILKASYVVMDETLLSLYKKQYGNGRFFSLGEEEYPQKDCVVFFTNNATSQQKDEVLGLLACNSSAEIVGLLDTCIFDNKESAFWEEVVRKNLKIKYICRLPKEISNSSPRNKLLISITGENESRIKLYQLDYDKANTCAALSDKSFEIRQEDLCGSQRLTAVYGEFEKCEETKTENKTYGSAALHAFTNEILVSYIYYDGPRSFVRVYYAKTKSIQMPLVRGKALTKRIEKTVHIGKDNIEEIVEQTAYEQGLSGAIVEDILTNYMTRSIAVSLKTLWFCLRLELKKSNSYNDEMARALFTPNNKELADINLWSDSPSHIESVVGKLCDEGEETKELQVIRLLNLIAETAIKKGYLNHNSVQPLISQISNRATKRQMEVRQALTKKSLDGMEERKMVDALLPLCRKSCLYLGAAIRFATGVALREVCALCWEDFVCNKDLGLYQLRITKFVTNEGKRVSHAMEDSWDKYRVLPIAKFLSDLLEARQSDLLGMGLDAEMLEEYPIVMQTEDVSHIRKGHKVSFCKPTTLAQKCREIIAKAEIPQQIMILPDGNHDMTTDINSYNGDIYRTNFRDKALTIARMELDELNYYLGLKGPDTFSQHYCDYTNDYVQLLMARKLDRWLNNYGSKHAMKKCLSGNDITIFHDRSVPGCDSVHTIELEIPSDGTNDAFLMSASSAFGCKIIAQTYGGANETKGNQ